MAAIRMTDLVRVKTLLGIDDTQTRYDELLMQMIIDATFEVETYLNRSLESKERTEQYDVVKGMYCIQVPSYPITSIAYIWNDYYRLFPTTSQIAYNFYYADNKLGIIHFNDYYLVAGRGALKIQYTGGMAVSTLDFSTKYPDIVSALTLEIAGRYQRRNTIGVISVSATGGSVAPVQRGEFLSATEDVLDRHRRF